MKINAHNPGIAHHSPPFLSLDLLGPLALSCLLGIIFILPTVQAAETVLIGLDSNDNYPSNATAAGRPAVSANGRYIAFQARGAFAEPVETGVQQIFWRDLVTGETENIHVGMGGIAANADAWLPSISDDGQLVAFVSLASNLVPGDADERADIFIHDRRSATLTRVTQPITPPEFQFQQWPIPYLSGDGSTIAFVAQEEQFGFDGQAANTLYYYDVDSGIISSPTFDANGERRFSNAELKGISDDGNKLLIITRENLDPEDDSNRGGYLYDRASDTFTWVTQNDLTGPFSTQGVFTSASMTGDARYIVFNSRSAYIEEDTDDLKMDFMLRDLTTGDTQVVTVTSEGNHIGNEASPFDPAISDDGQLVAFTSLFLGFVDGAPDRVVNVYVYDNARRKSDVVSTRPDGSFSDRGANGGTAFAASGRYLFFGSSDGTLDSSRADSVGGGTALYRRDRGLSCTDNNGEPLTIAVEPDQWHQLTTPCIAPEDANSVQAILGDDIPGTYATDWIVYVFEQSLSRYRALTLDDTMPPGTGFWLKHLNTTAATLDMPSGSRSVPTNFNVRDACLSETGCYALTAPAPIENVSRSAWSLQGNPLANAGGTDLSELRVTTETGTCSLEGGCTLDGALASNVAANVLFSWQDGEYQVLSLDSSLQPWQGTWFGELPGAEGNIPTLNFAE